MSTKLVPTKLGKEPLIDVVCGVSFDSDTPVDAFLPGLLLPKLTGMKPKFEALPAAQLPQVVRDSDPNLQNTPLMRVVIDERFTILIGSKWLGVGCQMPYAGWTSFKEIIQTVFSVIQEISVINSIERHSLKYVDFIENDDEKKSLSRFNLKIEIAGRKLSNEATQFRTEIIEPPFLHAATIVSSAIATRINGVSVDGSVVDVDTHRIEKFSVNDFLTQLPQLLDDIHHTNKVFFFDLLGQTELQKLDPKYD